jgi:hypothetical protein
MKQNSVPEDTLITVNVATKEQPADYWILDSGATNHVTGNRHLFECFHPMGKGEHQGKSVNNILVDAEGSGMIPVYVNRAHAK